MLQGARRGSYKAREMDVSAAALTQYAGRGEDEKRRRGEERGKVDKRDNIPGDDSDQLGRCQTFHATYSP